MKKLLMLSFAAMILSVTAFAQEKKAESKEPVKEEVYKVGDYCGDFEFVDIDGNKVKLSSFKGKYILVDIWATWCPPCKREIPHLQALEKRMHGRKIVFVSMSTDKNQKIWKEVVQDTNMTGIQLHSNGDWSFSKAMGANTIPHFVLLDKKGKIVDLKMTLRPSSGDEIYNYLMTKRGI